MDLATHLLDQALTGESRAARRQAFVELVASADGWRLVLAPHVISQQGYQLSDGFFPDRMTFAAAAPAIAASEEKIQHILELLGSRFSLDLCEALARQMGPQLVEHALAHLRTAQGERAHLLLQVLTASDRKWVTLPEARRAVRQRLRASDPGRILVLELLAEAGGLGDFVDELKDHPPTQLEEWNAVGRGQIALPELIERALALLATTPEVLGYLLRLEPPPERTGPRLMAAAKPDWLVQALEVAIILGLHSPLLVPLAELGARLGGRPMAAAVAWLGSARLGKELLGELGKQILRERGRSRLSDLIWVHRRQASANRALEEGRRGAAPDPLDAAALVRQLRGEKVVELIREILGKPRPLMLEPVLRHLCAVNPEAAAEVVALCHSSESELARHAREARQWKDVVWPADPLEEEEA